MSEKASKDYDPEQEIRAEGNWKIADLPKVEERSGEENTTTLFEARAKLYRFHDNRWKERGVGPFKFLKDNETKQIKGVLREEIMKKIRANFSMVGVKKLNKMATSKNSWFWVCFDFSSGEQQIEKFCIRFNEEKESQEFEKHFNLAIQETKKQQEENEKNNENSKTCDAKKEGEGE